MKISALSLLLLMAVGCSKEQPTTPPQPPMSKWISKVMDYRPAPGQFINSSIGKPVATSNIVGKKGMLTLGAYGGYVIFRFEKSIKNGSGVDFVIHGNAFAGSSEPGIVLVSVDSNGNGLADDKWVELKGANYADAIRNYDITYQSPSDITQTVPIRWSDNKGGTGTIDLTNENAQSYWPLWSGGAPLTFIDGCRIVNTPTVDEKNQIVLPALGVGYVDNFSIDYMQSVNGDADTQYANKFDLSNASEPMPMADFVKVYNCTNEKAGILGESSTEVCGAIIINY